MCRLALLNNEGIRLLEKNLGGINKLFEHLENAFGGHGNGIAVFYKDGSQVIKKGEKLKNKNISKFILKNLDEIEYVMYHTRLASVSIINDKNCHPFKDGEKILMMNGTESSYDLKNGLTDTENVLKSLSKTNMSRITKYLRSVFIGYDKGIFITKGKGDLMLLKKGNAIVFSSEFPEEYFDEYTIYEAPSKWNEGDRITLKNLKVCSFKTKGYTSSKYFGSTWTDEDRDEYYRILQDYYADLELCRGSERA